MAEEANKGSDLPPPYPGPPESQAPYPPAGPPYPTTAQPTPYPTGGQPAPYPTGGQPTPYPAPYQTAYPSATTTATTTVVNTQQPVTRTVIVAGTGGCPNCRVGTLVEEFTCCGICLAIFFFPLGLICCLMMRRRVCSHCHMMF